MPPGVTADWERYAYRFFNDAQYCRGLEAAEKPWQPSNIQTPPPSWPTPISIAMIYCAPIAGRKLAPLSSH